MKILLIHNFYGSSAPSGENTVYEAERDLLRRHGHEVVEFTRHSDEIRGQGAWGVLKGALATPWNPFSAARLRRVLAQERPDVLHVHNSFPLLSPSIFHAARSFPTATVLTLHNYRTFCTAGIPERNGIPCTECLDHRSVLPGLHYGCYRGSRLATLPMAAMIALHRQLGTWRTCVDSYIALTDFQKTTMAAAGLPLERIQVKPHFYAAPPLPVPWGTREPKAVYIGRLGDYKGVHILIEAWCRWGSAAPPLEIIGEGPERERLERMVRAGQGNTRIHFSGQLPFDEVQGRLARAQLLLLPSLCFEGFPMVIREAFALGVPVAGSRLGSIPCIVDDGINGLLFEPGNPQSLLDVVSQAWQTTGQLEKMGNTARRAFDTLYTEDVNYSRLMEIYQAAIKRRKPVKSEW